jgi:hypothetical protein
VITLNAKVLTVAILAVMIASSICYIDLGNSDGESNDPFYITDSNGNVIEFEQTSEHVILLGYGYTLSTIDLGCEENIVGVDYYTAKYMVEAGETQFEDLNIGNFYNADGCVQIATAILQMSEDGTFDLETDWIIAPAYTSITKSGGLIDVLNKYIGEGKYNLITLIKSASSYDDVIQVIEDLGKILGANYDVIVNEMEYVEYEITNIVENNNLSGAAAIQISSTGYVYNSSLMTSMITDILNGVNAGNNGGTAASYSTDYGAILQMAAQYENTVIFVDSSYSGITDLKNALPGYEVVVIEHQWDNICPEVTNCLWVMACALYPDYFTGDVPTVPAEEDNTMLYLGIGIVAAAIIAVVAVVLIKKH